MSSIRRITHFILGLVALANSQGPGEPLYLTPLIKAGEIERAQELSFVPGFDPIISHSGFITVNEEFNSNLFFWFFPAEASYSNPGDNSIPIILWSDGGPGGASMSSIFLPHGPFLPTSAENITQNPLSWHKKYHFLFVDQPVLVGFSHTSNSNGERHSSGEAAQDMYELLQQFYKLFPHLQSNPFYNAGGSYGGKYTTEIAHLIHTNNMNNPEIFINLTGLVQDAPWYDGYNQARYAEILYGAGLIGKGQRDEFLEKEETMRTLMTEGRWSEVQPIWRNYVLVEAVEATGYVAMYDMIDLPVDFFFDSTSFVTRDDIRLALHVGNISYTEMSPDVFRGMADDFMRSVMPKLDDLLKANYKFLILIGNSDVVCNHLGVKRALEVTSTWEGKDELVNGNRTIWTDENGVAGYITGYGRVQMIIVRNAGHGTFINQPKRILEKLDEFMEN